MKLVNTSTIEGFDQIICALKEKYKGHVISVNKEYYNTTDLTGLFTGSNTIASNVETLYYGLLTSGTDNEVTLNDQNGNEIITIAPNSQIIEVFSGLDIATTSTVNVQFRGIKIHIQGLNAIPRLEPFKYTPACFTLVGTELYQASLNLGPYAYWSGFSWSGRTGWMEFGAYANFRWTDGFTANTDYLFKVTQETSGVGEYRFVVQKYDGTIIHTENVVTTGFVNELRTFQFNSGANTQLDIRMERILDNGTKYYIQNMSLSEITNVSGLKRTRTSDNAPLGYTDMNKNVVDVSNYLVVTDSACPI